MTGLDAVRWGSATAAYQIEGAVRSDGRCPSIWDTFAATPGAIVHGDTGQVAANIYRNPEALLDAVEWLELETYRLSIPWCRIITGADGATNPAGVAYYRRLLEGLLDRDVRPVVTLYHWDLPQWLQDRGGWTQLATASAFDHFVTTAVREFGDLVDDWITINEPFCAAFHGHLSGLHAPGIRDEPTALRAAYVQLQAHGLALRTLRTEAPSARVGLAINLSDLESASTSAADVAATRRADLVENRLFLDAILRGQVPEDAADYFGAEVLSAALAGVDLDAAAEPLDFLGVNYYEHNVVRAAAVGNDLVVRGIEKLPVGEPRSANGVAVRPDGFARVLLRVAGLAPELPIWVTENGIGLWDYLGPDGTCNDVERVDFLDGYLAALADAIDQGARVEAYYHWSLMDTFEWSYGYQLRYGLFYVDFPTGRLLPKAGAEHYRRLARAAKAHRSADRVGSSA